MQQLKQLKKSNTPSIIENKERSQTKKHTAFRSRSQTGINTEITKIMTIIEQGLQTVLVYKEKIRTCLNTDQTHFEIF